MNIHEFQAKKILADYGVNIPRGKEAYSTQEALSIAKDIGGKKWVVKAQIHAGGRGKAGGVKIADSLKDVEKISNSLLGMQLVTHQTGPEGKKVNKIFIEEGVNIVSELYLGVVLDRSNGNYVMMASTEGGTEIEVVAEKTPEKIFKVQIDPLLGIQSYQARQLVFKLGLKKPISNKAVKFILALSKAVEDTDANLVEINPLVITKDDVLALDAKMNFDDNALFRQKRIEILRDEDEEDPRELEATKHDLNYISLDGNIGCMVNGAGLAMATMDIIKLEGGSPANFLDVGGGASKERVEQAFKIIFSDNKVKAVLINIFGGIMRCDVIAEGVVAAAKNIDIKVPLIVRLAGTNEEKGNEILDNSGLDIISADNLGDAAKKVVKSVKEL
ncbi:MAG: ADP-forming succinate--CoA ligase subunit beta [Pelagibacterales bacterium]|nr:ADP-forming succinate--CoA ligase subunit beta [Pelagibacterales bacterium]PPR16890.1 MAG: Succinyl-CoA ligase [ADP-forming] subunit beta [Alphaproteobacteria bacterium MarineAlpha9_Bin3]|tara:strand:- start:22023 stop:23186 length:1164 start_codon:yes stop_codon:yes gene_type:complete